jgi:hypothetical protein
VERALKEITITWGRKATFDESVQTSHQLTLELGTTAVSISSKGSNRNKKPRHRTPPQKSDAPEPKPAKPVRPRPKANPGVMAVFTIGKNGDLHILKRKTKSFSGNSNRFFRIGRIDYPRVNPEIVEVNIKGEQGELTLKPGSADKVRITIV